MSSRRPCNCWALSLVILVVGAMLSLGRPQPVRAQGETPVSITLTGWGWCVEYREVGNIVATLSGSLLPRDNAIDIQDIYLAGELSFNISGRSDNFQMELRGTKERSLFFLRQVTGGQDPLIAEFEGSWLGETNYVACEGRLAVPAPNHIAKPYFFVLRTEGVTIPERSGGGWVGNLEFVVQRLTGFFNGAADEVSSGGIVIQEGVGDLLAKVAVIARELRSLGIPYFT